MVPRLFVLDKRDLIMSAKRLLLKSKKLLSKPENTGNTFSVPTIHADSRVEILGLDISLSATGISLVGPDDLISTDVFETNSAEPHIARCLRIANKLSSDWRAMSTSSSEIVYVREDYAYAAQGVADVRLKELGGIVKAKFYEQSHMLHDVPISSWKKFITGKGNATKELAREAITCIYGSKVDKWTEHEVDATGIALTAQAVIYHKDLGNVRDYQQEVIDQMRENVSSLVLIEF